MKPKLLTLIFIVAFAACKKKTITAPPVTLKTYLSKQILSNLGTYTWTYDSQNRLQNIAFVSTNEASNPSYNFVVTSYDASNRIIEVLYDYTNPTKLDVKRQNVFDSNGRLMTQTFINATNSVLQSSTAVNYSGNTLTLKNKNSDGIEQAPTVYTISTDGKNLIKSESFLRTGELTGTTVYANFDDKKNPASLFPVGYGFFFGVQTNNSATITFTDHFRNTTTPYNYTYEYNTDGYMTKSIAASGAFDSYEYFKK